jgi:hypothetical protein
VENLADRLKVYAAKKSHSNKRNTLAGKTSVEKRRRLFARLAYCLLAAMRWQDMENPKWAEFYRSEAVALRRILHPRKLVVADKQDLTAWLLGEERKAA